MRQWFLNSLRIGAVILAICFCLTGITSTVGARTTLVNPVVPQGGSGTFDGTTAVLAVSYVWEIRTSTNALVASDSNPNGWNVTYAHPKFTVSAPYSATLATDYKVKRKWVESPQEWMLISEAIFDVVPVGGLPTVPTGLVAQPGNQKVTLHWTPSSGASSYDVKFRTSPGGQYTTVAQVSGTNFEHTGLTNGTTYRYVVAAKNSFGSSANSTEVTATPFALGGPFSIPPLGSTGYLAQALDLPGWMEHLVPWDSSDAPGGGPSSAISVSLFSGVASISAEPDGVVTNPVGSDLVFSRAYRTSLAVAGYSSPGLPAGWTHNWDIRIVSEDAGAWAPLRIVYPNGATDRVWPVMANGEPTGEFTEPAGAPYIMTGVPGTEDEGTWTSFTLRGNGTSKSEFVPTGTAGRFRLASLTEMNGAKLNLDYAGENLTRIWSSHSSYISYAEINLGYSGPGGLLGSVNAAGQQVNLSYQSGKLVAVSSLDSSAPQWSYAYANVGGHELITAVTTPGQLAPKTAYLNYAPDTGMAIGQTDANGIVRNYFYYQGSTTSIATSPTTGQEKFDVIYEPSGRILGYTDASGDTIGLGYSNSFPDEITQILPPTGPSITRIVDAHGNESSVTNVDGTKELTTWEYTADFPFGRPVLSQSLGKNGSVLFQTATSYYSTTNLGLGWLKDQVHQVTSDGVTTTFTYTGLGNIKSVTSPGFNGELATTAYTYHAGNQEKLGQPIMVTDPIGRQTTIGYDSKGRVTSVTDPLNRIVTAAYNNYDQLTEIVQAGQNSGLKLGYANGGKPATSVSNMTGQNQWSGIGSVNYDGEYGVNSTSAFGTTELYSKDADYDLTSLLNGNNRQTHTFTKNDQARTATCKIGAGSTATTWTSSFDKNGELIGSWSQRTNTIIIRNFDGSVDYIESTSQSGPFQPIGRFSFEYDSLGRLKAAFGSSVLGAYHHSRAFTYDQAGNLEGNSTLVGDQETQKVSYTYNAVGARTSMQVETFGLLSCKLIYTYNKIGWVTRIQGFNADGPMPFVDAVYEYDEGGRVRAVRTPVHTVLYTYNDLDQLTGLYNLTADGVTWSQTPSAYRLTDPYNNTAHDIQSSFTGITYDALGNRTGMNFVVRDGPNHDYRTGSISYGYFNQRLISESYTRSDKAPVSYAHSYDAAGNLTKLRNVTWAVSPDADRPTAIPSAILPQGVTSTLSYDSDGSITQAWDRELGFNGFQQLVSIFRAGGASGGGDPTSGDIETGTTFGMRPQYMEYDAFGHRTKLDAQPAGLKYIYDGDVLIGVEEWESSAGGTTSWYLWGPTGPVMQFGPGGSATGLTFDPQGSLVSKLDANAPQTEAILFDAYGQAVWGYGDQTFHGYSPFWYKGQAGQVSDPGTGLVYCHHRFYDPGMGRWISRDPIGLEGGVNVYAYCGGNPVMSADPSGLQTRPGGFWQYAGGLLRGAWNYVAKHFTSGDAALNLLFPGFAETVHAIELMSATVRNPAAVLASCEFIIKAASGSFGPEAQGEALFPFVVALFVPGGAEVAVSSTSRVLSAGLRVTSRGVRSSEALVAAETSRLITAARELETAVFQMHHLLPREFKSFYQSKGIDIEAPEYLVLVERQAHMTAHGKGFSSLDGYNAVWRRWIKSNPRASRRQVLNQLKYLRGKYGF